MPAGAGAGGGGAGATGVAWRRTRRRDRTEGQLEIELGGGRRALRSGGRRRQGGGSRTGAAIADESGQAIGDFASAGGQALDLLEDGDRLGRVARPPELVGQADVDRHRFLAAAGERDHVRELQPQPGVPPPGFELLAKHLLRLVVFLPLDEVGDARLSPEPVEHAAPPEGHAG